MNSIGYKNGQLHVENVSVKTIVEAAGTPVYCYSTRQISDNFHAWQSAMQKIMPDGKFTICYACKANSNLAVIKILGRLGAGMDVVSGGEMYRAFKTGIPAEKIVFSGVGKNRDDLTLAIKNNILQINIESESELNLIAELAPREGAKINVAFRINPDIDAKTHAKITTGVRGNKFGVDMKDAPELYRKAALMQGIAPTGIAVHIGSQLTDLGPFKDAFKSVADLVLRLRSHGIAIATVDLGGGLGITYKNETPISLDEYAALIRDIILPLNVHVVIEPGRSIVGNAGILLTRVLHVKEAHGKKFLIVDAAMNDLLRPALYDAYHPVIPCAEPEEKQAKTLFDVVGPVCETADTFMCDASLPGPAAAGDLLAVTVSGAYGAVMASTYNSRPLVPEVLVSDTQMDLIRKVQKIEDVVSNDIIPQWLA